MRLSKLGFAILAMTLFLGGFGAGRLLAGVEFASTRAADRPPEPSTTPTTFTPVHDVPGEDLADLPRYPGATHVEYRRTVQERFVQTELEYVTVAGVDAIREFYRDVFRAHDWLVADFGFSQGEWTFFVLSGDTEALVEIEARGSLVEIEIELSEPESRPAPDVTGEPDPSPALPSPTVTLVPLPPTLTPPPPSPSATPVPPPPPTLEPPPAPAPAPPPPAPPAPPADDGGDDDGDDRGDDDGGDDGGDDDGGGG